jgi:hypothetical protein
MLLLEKKAKCPLCGTKNPVDAVRCSICTRPLDNDPLPSQAVYQEALWSSRIASKTARKKANPYAVLGLLVVAAVIVNYFVVGLGPSWAHETAPVERGSLWKEQRSLPGYVADLPGTPMLGAATAGGSSLATASVWVDGHWDLVRDAGTQSVGGLAEANAGVHADLVLASGNAPADAIASLPAIVAAFVPGTQLAAGGVNTVQDPAFGNQLTLTTGFTGFPDEAGDGTVRATATVANGRIYVAASFVVGGDDSALHARLTSTFVPDGMPAK